MLIDQLKAKGYQYLYGPDIAPDGETPMRASFEEVVLRDKLETAVKRLKPSLPYSVQDEAVKMVLRITSPDVLANNEEFHRLLTEGVPVSVHKDGVERGARVWLIDFNDPWNNEFTVVNQFTIIENGHNRRPDVVLFVNGLPLVIFELKNAADENATLQSAYRQIETYKQQIPSLFTYNGLVVISDGLEARAGSLSAGFSAGFGSQFGPGYALDLRLVTLEAVPESFRAQFEAEAVGFLQHELDQSMPERRLKIVRDVNGWKIVGDLSIGTAGAATSTPAPSGTTPTTGDNMNRTYKAKIAVQLYSIHQYTKAVGLKKTIEDVAKIGYAGVEFAGYWDFSSAELKQMLSAVLGAKAKEE